MYILKLFKKTCIILLSIWGIYSLAILTKILDRLPKSANQALVTSYMLIFFLLLLSVFVFGIMSIIYDPIRKNNPKQFWINFLIYLILGGVITTLSFGKNLDTLTDKILLGIFGGYYGKCMSYMFIKIKD